MLYRLGKLVYRRFMVKAVTGSAVWCCESDLTFVPSSPASLTGSQLSAEPSRSTPPRGRWPQFVVLCRAECGGDPGGFRVSCQCLSPWGWEDKPAGAAAAGALTLLLQDRLHCVMQIRVQELTSCCQEVMVVSLLCSPAPQTSRC